MHHAAQPRWRATTPREAALAILAGAFGGPREQDESAGPVELTEFQREAVGRAETAIARYGGVVIADGVGTGKTFVGVELARRTVDRGGSVLVVSPAALKRHWHDALRPLRRHGAAASIAWLSQTALSRGADVTIGAPVRVVVDEAHGFRNPRTRRYAALARLCRSAEVVLLTATPINNSLLDLYFQLRLFVGDASFSALGVADLGRAFRAAALAPDATTHPALAAVVREIVIRRPRDEITRVAMSGGGSSALRFPRRAPPRPIRYDLDAAFAGRLADALGRIESLALAAFRLDAYGGASSPGAAELIRLLLLKRLESGTAALRATLRRIEARTRAALEAIEQGLLPAVTPVADAEQLVMQPLLLQPAPRALDRDRFRADVAADLATLHSLEALLPGAADDPKTSALRTLLFEELAGQKVLVFTEFRETAIELWRAFAGRGGVGLIHGESAFLGSGRAGRRQVVTRFAPQANGAPAPSPREAVRVLIATDVLAEGLNLQDAAHVVSYDLPWNPVRLMQRIGRIDRLGSPHATIHPHNFLPAAGLDAVLGLVERLRRKLAAIRAGLGPAAGSDRRLTAVERGTVTADPDTRWLVDRIAAEDPLLLDELDRAAFTDAEIERRLRQLAPAAPPSTARPPLGMLRRAGPRAAIVGLAWRGRTWILLMDEDRQVAVQEDVAMRELYAALAHPAETVGSPPACASASEDACETTSDGLAPDITRAGDVVATARAWMATHRQLRLGAGSPAATVARLVRHAAAATPGGPDPALCARVDRLLERLASAGRAGDDAALAEMLARWTADGVTGAAALCAEAERALGPDEQTADAHAPDDGTAGSGLCASPDAQPDVPCVIGCLLLQDLPESCADV